MKVDGVHICCPECGSDEVKKENEEPDIDMPERDTEDLFIRFQMSCSPQELKNAYIMIELADDNPNIAGSLYASSIIMLISILENDTRSFFLDRAKYIAYIDEVDFRTTQAFQQSELSLRQRMRILPEVASRGVYTINKYSKDIRVLNDMISKRNYLIHRKDYTLASEVASIKDVLHEGMICKKFGDKLEFGFDLRNLSRFSALKSEALECYHAVKKYVEEVVFAVDEDREILESDSELLVKMDD